MSSQYSIQTENYEGTTIYSLRNAGISSARIVPEWGNNCFEFNTRFPVLEEIPFSEFRKKPRSYGIPILFPYPNRIKDNRFSFRNRNYEVDQPQHGFVRDKAWKVEDVGSSAEAAWIRSSLSTEKDPFVFRLEVTYNLSGTTLEMITQVKNTGQEDMPFGFGIHPYFRKPNPGTLQVFAGKYWELNQFIPTGKLLNVTGGYDLNHPQNIAKLQLDDIFTDLKSGDCILTDEANRTKTVVEFSSSEFPHVVVYTPPPPRNAICIEPYTCPTDAFNLQSRGINSDVLILTPSQEMTFTIRIHS
jgi:aldose 1-epimerase